MIQVLENLWIGSKDDYYTFREQSNFSLCLASKTFHKFCAKLDGSEEYGYQGNMPKDQTEYLIAYRPEFNILAVNLIDAPDVNFIPSQIIERCLAYIEDEMLLKGRDVAVLCDKGQSRSACIVFMYLLRTGTIPLCKTFEQAEKYYKDIYCESYEPNTGMREYTRKFYQEMINNGKEHL